MLSSQIDHITVTAASLEEGAQYVIDALGIAPQPGGEHPRMGTHNLLMRLGESTYLEVIAPNPDAPAPDRPRWFALDDAESVARPRLATWVARTDDIHTASVAAPEPLGKIEPMSRASLNWLISIPEDGALVLGGAAPALIEWQVAAHPASGMADLGCTLERLELFHPDAERVTRLLRGLGMEGRVHASALPAGSVPFLLAHVRTPRGLCSIGGT
ncbi:MAG TPA: VOC family protein [Noviherbaspirillum sp.]|nr:VOC family protein [Noviherbaspirillum sp.]